MNKLFDQFQPPEEDVSWGNNVDYLDSFEEINSLSLLDDDDDDTETEVFTTGSGSSSDYEPDSTTHLGKKLKLPQEKTDLHSVVEKDTGYEFVCSHSQVANFVFITFFISLSKFSCHVVQ